MNKGQFAVISSYRECRTMCNIHKKCYPLILTGSILQATFSWSRNCRFYEIRSPVVTFAEAIHWVVSVHFDPVSTLAPYSSLVVLNTLECPHKINYGGYINMDLKETKWDALVLKYPKWSLHIKLLNQNCLYISHAVVWNITKSCLQGTSCGVCGEKSGSETHFLHVLQLSSVTMCSPMLHIRLSTITDAT
jgi:hypothetical protein